MMSVLHAGSQSDRYALLLINREESGNATYASTYERPPSSDGRPMS